MNALVMEPRVFRLVQMFALLMLTGCGGGGGGDAASVPPASLPPASAPPPPLGVTETFLLQYAVSIGPSFDCPESLGTLVGGVFFGVLAPCIDAAAVVTADGQPFDAAPIPDGSVAIVRGSRTVTNDPLGPRETSVATTIDIQRIVVGTIESVDSAHARFLVLGQQIYVSDITRISGGGAIDALAEGDRVAVSGFFSPTGEVVATAISRDAGGEGFVLRGILHITESGVLEVGRLVVGSVWDYAFEGFPNDTPEDGHPVLVLADSPPSDGVLSPYSVRYIGGDLGEGPEDIRFFEGMVSNRPAPSEMDVEGRTVDCVFLHCEEAREAQIGTLVSVLQGARVAEPVNRAGVLEPASDNISVVGRVGAVDVLNGALSVLGFPIQVLPATAMNDQAERPKRISDIGIGDMVTVTGGPVGDLLVAGRILTYGGPILQISTRVAAYADPEIHVLAGTILTDQTTVVYEDCVGQRDQRWLFEVAAESSITQLRMEVSQESGGEIFAARVDVDTNACYPWG